MRWHVVPQRGYSRAQRSRKADRDCGRGQRGVPLGLTAVLAGRIGIVAYRCAQGVASLAGFRFVARAGKEPLAIPPARTPCGTAEIGGNAAHLSSSTGS